MKPLEFAVLGAGDRGFNAFGKVARKHPEKIRFIAVAEPDEERRRRFIREFNIRPENSFGDWRELLSRPQMAAAVLNTLQDGLHLDSTLQALEKGYHVLLEKPMAVNARDCVDLVKKSEETRRILQICHVLRYSRIFSGIKDIIESGDIGDVICIQHNENIGFWHMAHSYVRGNWRRTDRSSPIILAKSCHDTDLLTWYAGSGAKLVSSFGSLTHYRREKAPPGAPERCTDGCPHEKTCPYSAVRFYLHGGVKIPLSLLTGLSIKSVLEYIKDPTVGSFTKKITSDLSKRGIMETLRSGPYGRCVYRCDNNVCDHQVLIVEFENGVKANFTLSAFTPVWERTMKIMGTKGEIRAADFKGRLEIRSFYPMKARKRRMGFDAFSHGGGDEQVMLDFVSNVLNNNMEETKTSARNSLESHLIAFAAEESRLTGKTIEMKEYRHRLGI